MTAVVTPSAEPVWRLPPREGAKDTIDSIVVAFILAFVFRAFVVEAFRIPTGSMAPTLYGVHGTLTCDDCGTTFAYGLKDFASRGYAGDEVGPDTTAACPNCNHKNRTEPINDTARNGESGDRILVLKWPYHLGGRFGPKRWDVVVFKDPADGTTNFIKRLVGLPGEVLMILDGDVYTVPAEELSPKSIETLERLIEEKHTYTTPDKPGGRIRPVPGPTLAELYSKLRVARKTEVAQKSLWFVVYDHDYPPTSLPSIPVQPRWHVELGAASGWDTTRRRIRFEDKGNPRDMITLSGKPIDSRNAYNISRSAVASAVPAVGDHRIRFVLTPDSEEGQVYLRLRKLDKTFWASIRMNGRLALYESEKPPTEDSEPMITTELPRFASGVPVPIVFQNLDYRVSLTVNDKQVLETSSNPASPAFYGPNLERLRQLTRVTKAGRRHNPAIGAQDGSFDLTHLVVERDIYYTQTNLSSRLYWAPPGWGTRDNPIFLREGEYFMLGDNSAASKDSRLWDTVGNHLKARGAAFQLGTVPEDQLIGRAFFVYWPSGLRLDWLPRLRNFGPIPDVGRMRWIR